MRLVDMPYDERYDETMRLYTRGAVSTSFVMKVLDLCHHVEKPEDCAEPECIVRWVLLT